MEVNNFLTKTWFESKICYSKKCVNYDNSKLQQNSITDQKDQNIVTKKMAKSKIKF